MPKSLLFVLVALVASVGSRFVRADGDMFDPDNLKAFGCAMADKDFSVLEVNKAGAIFYPGEEAELLVQVTRKDAALKSVMIGVEEITTRHGKLYDKPMGWSMTPPPVIEVVGKPVTVEVPVNVEDRAGATGQVRVKLPLPQRYGCYLVTIAPNGKDPRFLCSALRAMKPIDGFSTAVPMLAEGGSFVEGGLTEQSRNDPAARRQRAQILTRLGVKVVRWELPGMWGWKPDGSIDWTQLDQRFAVLEEAKLKTVVTLGAVSYEAMPFIGPTPGIVNWMQDHTPAPKYLPEYGRWVTEFSKRFGKNGNGALWAIECWNEPWEPLSTSGFESDSIQYRAIFKEMADGVHRANAGVLAVTACSVMNLEDKFLTGEDRADWMSRIDMLSDHYVMPPNNYGSMVGRKWGKEMIETETWGASTEMLAIQFVTQFLACGDKMIDPMQAPMMYYNTPGGSDEYRFPKPAALSANVLNVFLTGRPFQRMLFLKHLPFAFQFGQDQDAVVVVLGRLRPNLSAFGGGTRDSIWWQLNQQTGGEMTVDNADGALEVFDVAGNRVFENEKSFTIPLDLQGWYIRSPHGGVKAISEHLAAAKITGIRPVEIIAHDLGMPIDAPSASLNVTLHNLLNRPITGKLKITAPAGITLKADAPDITLAAGESRDVPIAIAHGVASEANAYDFGFTFESDAGKADWNETLHVLRIHKSAKKIGGDLADWKDDLPIPVRATAKKTDATVIAWQPFNKFVEQQPDGSFAELKAAYDEKFFYIAARVNDPGETPAHLRLAKWDQEQYFHNTSDDALCESLEPYWKLSMFDPNSANDVARVHADPKWPEFEKIIKSRPEVAAALSSGMMRFYWERKNTGHPITFANAPRVYKKDFAPDSPYNGNSLQFSFDVIDGYDGHDLQTDTDRVPAGFHAMPDTDYEFAAYACTDGGAELWRLLAPGMQRSHYFPRQVRGKFDQGAVEGGQCIVKREGKIITYQIAIPWSEMKDWHPRSGQTFGFTFRFNRTSGPALVFGENKSATKTNGLTMHPYWSGQPSCTVRWTLE